MARHRNVRSMNYEDEYYDDDDEDMYSRSVEDGYCISPSTADQYSYKYQERNLSSFMRHGRIEEDEEDREAGGGGRMETEEDQLQFSDLSQAQFDSCMDGIKGVLGDTFPEQAMSDAILRNNYNVEAAINDLLSLQGAPKQQRQPRQRNRSSGDSFPDSDSDVDALSNTPTLVHDLSFGSSPAFLHFDSSVIKSSSSRSTLSEDSESFEGGEASKSELQVGSCDSDVFLDPRKVQQCLKANVAACSKVDTNANLMNLKSCLGEKSGGDGTAPARTIPATRGAVSNMDFTRNASSLTSLARQHEQNQSKLTELSLRNASATQLPSETENRAASGLQALGGSSSTSQLGGSPRQASLSDLAKLHQQQTPQPTSLLSGSSLLSSLKGPGAGQTAPQSESSSSGHSGTLRSLNLGLPALGKGLGTSAVGTSFNTSLGLPSLNKGLATEVPGSGAGGGLGLNLGFSAAPSVSLSSLAKLHQAQSKASSTSLPSSTTPASSELGFHLGSTSSTPSLSSLALSHQQAAQRVASTNSLLNMQMHSAARDSPVMKTEEQAKPKQGVSLADLAAQHTLTTAGSKGSLIAPDGLLSSSPSCPAGLSILQQAPQKATPEVPLSLLSALRVRTAGSVTPAERTKQSEVRSRSPSPVPAASDSAVSQDAEEVLESDMSLLLSKSHVISRQGKPSVLAKALGCQLRRRQQQCPYRRFSYSIQARGCKEKPTYKICAVVPFDFATPSPDDLVKEKQKKAFTRVEDHSLTVPV